MFYFEFGLYSEVVVCILVVQIDGYKFPLHLTTDFVFDSSDAFTVLKKNKLFLISQLGVQLAYNLYFRLGLFTSNLFKKVCKSL